MITRAIRRPDAMKIRDEAAGVDYVGGNQEWYVTQQQRLSGCGPTVSAAILHYLRLRGVPAPLPVCTRAQFLKEMEHVWNYVTPGIGGIPSVKRLREGLEKYAAAAGRVLHIETMDILKCRRAPIGEALAFLDSALARDLPVAFLNLHNGSEPELDAWHWVTVISLIYEPADGSATIHILDEGLCKTIDFANWYRTSRLGGGLASFVLE